MSNKINDLIENKILLGQRLEPMQASILLLGDEYVVSGAVDESPLDDHQRRQVREAVLMLAAVLTLISVVVGVLVWYYMTVIAAFIVFALYMCFSRFGRIKLGRDGEEPEFSWLSWFAMLFSAGMGVGLVFYGVAEPLTYATSSPKPGWTGDDCNTRDETCNCFGGENDVCLIGTDCDTPCGAVLGSDADLSCSGRPFVTGENLRRVDGSACVCLPGWWGADCTSACPGIDADSVAGR